MPNTQELVKAGPSAVTKTRKSQDYKVLYANASRMRMSQADIQVYFGLLTDDPNAPGTFTNEEIVSVIMAPQHAKVFALSFLAAISSYETKFGEIKLPPEIANQLEAVKNQLAAAVAADPKSK